MLRVPGIAWSSLVLTAFCFSSFASVRAQEGTIEVEPLSGESIRASVVSLAADGSLSADARALGDWSEIRRISWDRTPEPGSPDRWQVRTVGGGLLGASRIAMGDETVAFETRSGRVEVPIEKIVGIRHVTVATTDAPPANATDDDQLVVSVEGASETLVGVVEGIDDQGVAFSFDDQTRTIPWERVTDLTFARAGMDPVGSGARVLLSDGDVWFGEPSELDDRRLVLAIGDSTSIEFGIERLIELHFVSDRVLQLSSQEPIEASAVGLLLPVRAWQRDRSVDGSPFRLDSSDPRRRSFTSGLGIPSGTRLTFACEGFDRFRSIVGIDASAGGGGDCVIVVETEGREVLRERLTSGSEPLAIDLLLDGVSRLTLSVEFGEGLELGDHVDWCDARLLKTGPR